MDGMRLKKRFTWAGVALVATVVLFLQVHVVGAESSPETFLEGIVEWDSDGHFKDKIHYFTITVPTDWELGEIEGATALYRFLVRDSEVDGGFRANFNISVIPGTPFEIAEVQLKKINEELRDVKLLEKKDVAFRGERAMQQVYSFSYSGLQLFSVVWIVEHPRIKRYSVVLTGTASMVDNKIYYSRFRELFGTLRFFTPVEVLYVRLKPYEIQITIGFAVIGGICAAMVALWVLVRKKENSR